MLKFLKVFPLVGAATLLAAPGFAQDALGIGRPALPDEIAAWDIDVRPDGLGLPEGSGDVWTGEEVFVAKCAACHGDFGEAVGRWPALAGGQGTLERDDPVKTIGSYWPYLSTVYDYVNRAMPFGEAQSLEPDEIYAITAYLLYLNNLVDDDFELNNENFTQVRLPNEDNFFMDDRAETELVSFTGEVCMTGCKESVEITRRAAVLDVTPEAEDDVPVEDASTEEAPADDSSAAIDPELIALGEGAFRQCRACHEVGPDGSNRTGPALNGVIGRTMGTIDGFRYSNVFKEAAEAGEVWTHENLAAYLADPRGQRPGTKMSFRGVRDEAEIAGLIAYLESIASP